MNQNGWCPIISKVESMSKCMKNECAWWDNGELKCVVFTISEELIKMTEYGGKFDDVKDTISEKIEGIGELIKK